MNVYLQFLFAIVLNISFFNINKADLDNNTLADHLKREITIKTKNNIKYFSYQNRDLSSHLLIEDVAPYAINLTVKEEYDKKLLMMTTSYGLKEIGSFKLESKPDEKKFDGAFEEILGNISTSVKNKIFKSNKDSDFLRFDNLISKVKYFVYLCLLIYIMVFGFKLAADGKVGEFWLFALKMVAVLHFSTGIVPNVYDNGIFSILDQIISMINDIVSYIIGEKNIAGKAPFAGVFKVLESEFLNAMTGSKKSWFSFTVLGTGIDIILTFIAVIMTFLMFIDIAKIYLSNLLLLYFLAYISPIFIPTLLVDNLKKYFNQWLNFGTGACLQLIVTAFFVKFSMFLIKFTYSPHEISDFGDSKIWASFVLTTVVFFMYRNIIYTVIPDLVSGLSVNPVNFAAKESPKKDEAPSISISSGAENASDISDKIGSDKNPIVNRPSISSPNYDKVPDAGLRPRSNTAPNLSNSTDDIDSSPRSKTDINDLKLESGSKSNSLDKDQGFESESGKLFKDKSSEPRFDPLFKDDDVKQRSNTSLSKNKITDIDMRSNLDSMKPRLGSVRPTLADVKPRSDNVQQKSNKIDLNSSENLVNSSKSGSSSFSDQSISNSSRSGSSSFSDQYDARSLNSSPRNSFSEKSSNQDANRLSNLSQSSDRVNVQGAGSEMNRSGNGGNSSQASGQSNDQRQSVSRGSGIVTNAASNRESENSDISNMSGRRSVNSDMNDEFDAVSNMGNSSRRQSIDSIDSFDSIKNKTSDSKLDNKLPDNKPDNKLPDNKPDNKLPNNKPIDIKRQSIKGSESNED